jgi:hypothetical protein
LTEPRRRSRDQEPDKYERGGDDGQRCQVAGIGLAHGRVPDMRGGSEFEHPSSEFQAGAEESDEGRHGIRRPGKSEGARPQAEQRQRETGEHQFCR